MIRLATMMTIGFVLLFAGCGRGGLDLEGRADAAGGDIGSSDAMAEVKSPIVRALLQAIDEIKGESPEAKEELRRSLLAADDELAQALGDHGKELILDANKKPEVRMIGGSSDASEKPSVGKRRTPVVKVRQLSPAPGNNESDQPQTGIIRALLAVLDESEGDDDAHELRTTLIEADKQLRQVLGGQSKHLIEAANRKPLVPMIGPRPKAARGKKTPAPKAKAGGASFKPVAADLPGPSNPSREPATKIVKALIEAIDQIEDEDLDTKQELKQSLLEADLELSRFLGSNSKRLIHQANKKPVVPTIRGTAHPKAREGTEKE